MYSTLSCGGGLKSRLCTIEDMHECNAGMIQVLVQGVENLTENTSRLLYVIMPWMVKEFLIF